jgi:hypothetical protein
MEKVKDTKVQEALAKKVRAAIKQRFGKEVEIIEYELSRTESTGRVFLYVLITRRSSVQI